MTTYSAAELLALLERMKAAETAGASLLDLITPNGKKVRDCTGAEIEEVGKQLTTLGQGIDFFFGKA
jgi:hypothetical protein